MLWDVVVIGAGPAGMMAAGRAGERGKKVLLLEKNPTLGKKLLLTGGGRCNVTNNCPETRTMLARYKDSDKFLFSAFAQFNVKDTLDFFNKRGLATKIEDEGRVFPVSDKAQSILEVLVDYLKEGNVELQSGQTVAGIFSSAASAHITIKLADGQALETRACILATGGNSHPETGSTGEAFLWLRKLGHLIIDTDVALVPIELADAWTKKISGVTLDDVKLTTFQNNKKQKIYKGSLLFTHFGISGPTVLNMSKEIGELLKNGEVTIALDLFPNFDHGALKIKLQNLFVDDSNKKLANTLAKLMPTALVHELLTLAKVNGDTPNHSVPSVDRKKLITLFKEIPLHVKGLLGADKAIASSGGVELEEINFKTMQSRLIPNLYLVGDVLNIDRPSGGYSLQLCWTTGFVAGNSC
ncbi:MAG: Flavoprotein, HI0933 family [Parcubacteria group bacterium GW2011_GWC2_44_22]|nr:MAG: Flavoprotein, HI0933 family [Parcubacteria group bacterium GW2011_GWC2_44_22]